MSLDKQNVNKEIDLAHYSKLEELDKQVQKLDNDSMIISYYYIEGQCKILAGKILTIIDASINDKQQNKCVKDLIRAEFYRRINEFQNMYWNGKQGHSVKLESSPKDPLN